MPEFILNTPPTPDEFMRAVAYGYLKPVKKRKIHPYWILGDFAQGYVEAMFFTNCDTGDAREDHANELGVGRLTRTSVAAIERDCDNFQGHAEAAIAAVLRHGKRDLADMGRDFWFTRQGHGVGFWEGEARGYPGSTGEVLTHEAKRFGEAYPEIHRGWIYVK